MPTARPPVVLPPGPRRPPLVQGLQWVYRPVPFIEMCAKRFGDWFTLRFPRGYTFVFTTDPAAIKEIFAGDPEQLHAGKANAILKPILGEHSLLLLDGQDHLRERRMMMPPFHGERMHTYGRVMASIADESIKRWPRGRAFPVQPEMQAITMGVILRTVFGVEEGATLTELGAAINVMLTVGTSGKTINFVGRDGKVPFEALQLALGSFSPWGRISKLIANVDRILLGEIAKRRKQSPEGRDDVLTMLLAAKDEQGRGLTDKELRDEMITLLLAGHETTATALSWLFWRLTKHPEVQEKLRAEVLGACKDGRIEPERLGELKYLDAVIKETLRLNPIIPFVARWIMSPVTIAGRELPAGVLVCPAIYLTHRRPDLWPDPERFDPERFLDKRLTGNEYFPFGGGTRRCIGMAFALFEMKIIAAQALCRLKLLPAPGYKAGLYHRGLSFAPTKGMPLVVEKA
ncbi:MAG: cytochrome P450 [Elusimicrobia bacterium]|nr:cytochrome P450 [Elusimicrobiota bacterium]